MVMYLAFSLMPLVFHDCSWAWVAYLRHFNVTDNDSWLVRIAPPSNEGPWWLLKTLIDSKSVWVVIR